MDYAQRPRARARTLGLGILTGSALEDGDILSGVQENIQFRIESAREMLMGGGTEESMSPLDRRMEIQERRRGLVMGDGSESSGRSGTTGSSGGSGMLSDSSTSSASTGGSSESSTPSMSDVNRGTKARAEERGFGA